MRCGCHIALVCSEFTPFTEIIHARSLDAMLEAQMSNHSLDEFRVLRTRNSYELRTAQPAVPGSMVQSTDGSWYTGANGFGYGCDLRTLSVQ